MKAIIFDLDDTLIDTSESFDLVVCQLVEAHSGKPLERSELGALRSQGGFNCDWDSTVELLRRRGVTKAREQMAEEGLARYLQIAQDAERLMVEETFLPSLAKKVPLFVVTGRVRAEYQPIWAQRLDPHFTEVVCRDDRLHLKPKPSPDQILDLMQRHNISQGCFVGNSVDDMRAGTSAQLTAIGVTTNQSAENLKEAGASHIVPDPRLLSPLLSNLFPEL